MAESCYNKTMSSCKLVIKDEVNVIIIGQEFVREGVKVLATYKDISL